MDVDINILTRWAGELESLAEATGLGGMFRTADDDDLPSCLRSAASELDRLRAENAALRKAALEVFYNSVTNCECTTVRESDMIALGEVLGVYGVQEKPAENGAGGA